MNVFLNSGYIKVNLLDLYTSILQFLLKTWSQLTTRWHGGTVSRLLFGGGSLVWSFYVSNSFVHTDEILNLPQSLLIKGFLTLIWLASLTPCLNQRDPTSGRTVFTGDIIWTLSWGIEFSPSTYHIHWETGGNGHWGTWKITRYVDNNYISIYFIISILLYIECLIIFHSTCFTL